MSIWTRILGKKEDTFESSASTKSRENGLLYAFVDVEVGMNDHKVHDIGALRFDDAVFHASSKKELLNFLKPVDYVCGHNIIHHDIPYLFGDNWPTRFQWVDTLYMSPILFPDRPYHKLVKDDKLCVDELNNPVNDCKKCRDLLMDEIAQWQSLPEEKKRIFAALLNEQKEFAGFLDMVNAPVVYEDVASLIKTVYAERICQNADVERFIREQPCALAYALSLVDTSDYHSITPGWVLHHYPNVEEIICQLCHTRCSAGCSYCQTQLDVHHNLKSFFGFDEFRTYNGEPLQEKAAKAAVDGKSLLAIFPTGGGKSLTFQLPALMAGQVQHGLTVVISPLQSLMKDQVDNLADRGIADAVTINGLLDPISRSLAIQRVQDGDASLLYIAPEMLRSKTIEKLLLSRQVVRFVIDEAHCFSAWGQDFRVDYLYIGEFIKQLQDKKGGRSIPVSCFTATAKQKVIQDICDYFKDTLGLQLEIFASSASRTNLQYAVIHAETDEDKYLKLRGLLTDSVGPAIVYVSRTKKTLELATKLTRDGLKALPFNGKMEADKKIETQDAFMNDQVRIIVATSAFGMGVDKKDVGLVVHYDISDSLENYVQEAGRAGRDPKLEAKCFVLYSDSDLDKHFILLNQTKLSISEIQQVWKAVKDLTKQRMKVCCSALEIARQAGWDDSVYDIETRVKTALATLERGGYVKRGNNVPHVYATGITVRNVEEARKRITKSSLFDSEEVETAVRIIKSLISQKNIVKKDDKNQEAESRVDYLADILGLNKATVVSTIERMRQDGILADTKDLTVFWETYDSQRKSRVALERYSKLEKYILEHITDDIQHFSFKQLNDNAIKEGITTAKEKDVRTLIYFLTVKGYVKKRRYGMQNVELLRIQDQETTLHRFERRIEISRAVLDWLFYEADLENVTSDKRVVHFSVIELLKHIQNSHNTLFGTLKDLQLEELEESLLYLSKIGALKLEGGFLVLYNAMDISRLKDNKYRYKQDDYRMLNEFYKQKIQQVHIVGEYANLMVKDYNAALQYVQDYFQMDYKAFVAKYFKGNRAKEIQSNVTPRKYKQLFAELSPRQMEIISDKESRCIVVAAGPGSGKTRVLVHKLASLLLMEDVKHEQLLMLTFSRAAATEFKLRLMELIGNAAHFVDIKTFHSFCFDLLGRVGNLEEVNNVVAQAAAMIESGEVEPNRLGKTVLVIDEAQDMSQEEFALVSALMTNNEEMRVIAVGDDDQNIYEFRGSDSSFMYQLVEKYGGRFLEMTQNYRSAHSVVRAANRMGERISHRMKQEPIVSMRDVDGYVRVISHTTKEMYAPIVEELQSTTNGKAAVLTMTNEEAAIMVALLRSRGIRAQLIQSLEGIRFWNLAEMRYFLKMVESKTYSPIISEPQWENAKSATRKLYGTSSSLQYVVRCLEQFEKSNKTKYLSDFKEFVFESSIEDFCDYSNADVVVSTIHKAKGKEFDDVFLMISDGFKVDDNMLRRLYVGITRAKNRLFIHTNGPLFEHIFADNRQTDAVEYKMPEEVVLQLTHKDVFLGYFKDKKKDVLMLRGGDDLSYANFNLMDTKTQRPVARLSQKMQDTVQQWGTRGYQVRSAKVRYVVAWKPKDAAKEEPETAVLLADLYLKRER